MISILLPNYNSGLYVHDCIESIRSQKYSDFEVIICDSGSSDVSRRLLEAFAEKDKRVQFYLVPKEGIYPGWNQCLKRASGDYIYVATSDDIFSLDWLGAAVKQLDANGDVDLAYCRLVKINAEGDEDNTAWENAPYMRAFSEWFNKSHLRRSPGELYRSFFLGHPVVSMNQVVIRRSLFEKTGPFPEDVGSHGDVLWHLRALYHSDLMFVHGPWAAWRVHEGQASTTDGKMAAIQCLECRERFIGETYKRVPKAVRRGMALSRFHLLRRGKWPFIARPGWQDILNLINISFQYGLLSCHKCITRTPDSLTSILADRVLEEQGIEKLI